MNQLTKEEIARKELKKQGIVLSSKSFEKYVNLIKSTETWTRDSYQNFQVKNILGNYGEELIKKELLKKYPEEEGYKILKSPPVPHLIDFSIVKDEEIEQYAEVKTYPKRKYYPDTGFNQSHYDGYKELNDTLSVTIYFVDYEAGEIYYQAFTDMEEEIKITHPSNPYMKIKYPRIEKSANGDRRYYPLEIFIKARDLTPKEIATVKRSEEEYQQQLKLLLSKKIATKQVRNEV